MQARLVDKKAVEATIEVMIPASEVNATFEKMVQNIARQVRVPGFRPGKAPRNIIIQQIGEDALRQEVRDNLVEQNYPKAVKELNLTAINAHLHNIKEPKENEDFSFEVHVDLYPEFKLSNYKDIVIDTPKQEMTDDMLHNAVENLQREYATLVPVERAIEDNDYVVLEMGDEGSRLPIDLERAGEQIRSQLVGKTMGEEIELDLAEPQQENELDKLENAMNEAMDALDEAAAEASEMTAELEHVHEDASAANEESSDDETKDDTDKGESANPLKIKVKVADVKAKEKPATDDEFAKTLGMESWAQVEERLRRNIQADLDSQTLSARQNEFIEKLLEETNVDLPKYLIDRRKHMLMHDLEHELEHNKMTMEQYYKELDEKGEREKFEAELQESAETRVKRDLVLEQLLEERGTKLSNTEFENAIAFMAQREGKNVRNFKKEMGDTWLDNYRFLLTRDKAVREVVRELVGETKAEEAVAAQ